MVRVHLRASNVLLAVGPVRPLVHEQDIVRRFTALILLAVMCMGWLTPARAIESVRVPLDSQAIDLTHVIEHYGSQGDRLQVSTAPGSDGIVRRIEVQCPRTRHAALLDRLRADQRYRRAARAADRRAAFPPRRLGRDLARSRRLAHLGDHREPGLSAGTRGFGRCRHLPSHARSRHDGHLCRRTAHARICRSSISGSPTPTTTRRPA